MVALPPLRQVEPVPITLKGEQMICLTDPYGYVEEQIVLSPPAFFIATCLDGTRDVAAIQKEFSEAFGGFRPPEQEILAIVESLDESGFLYSEKFRHIQQRVENAFRALHVRPATLAGQAYPQEPTKLRERIDRFFTAAQGEGCLARVETKGDRPLRGLIAPHIDYERGGKVYGAAYQRLYASGRPDLVLLFGVAHCGAETPFVLTRKHFETPLGTLETDQDAVSRLEAACPWDPYATEMAHRMEHSLELQAVMLARLYGEDAPPIVPILCAFPGDPQDTPSGEQEAIAAFLTVCAEMAREPGRAVTVIAGADLAHVGRRFGDDVDVSDALIASVRQCDFDDLRHVETGDADGFFDAVMKDGNARHVCGLGCIYALLKTLDGSAAKGELLAYDYGQDPAGGMVSFAAIAME